ncbi:MAG: twin-arginine translocase TatA/TatE family subunit [Candidatus Sulfotelmatobacter sp.]|jgi:Sec-independent protein translocase protein TatA
MSLTEIIFIGLLALVVFGPRKLAAIAPEIGKMLQRLKATSNEFKSQIEREVTQSTTVQTARQGRVDGAPVP